MGDIITMGSGKMVHGTLGKWVMDGTGLRFCIIILSSASNYCFLLAHRIAELDEFGRHHCEPGLSISGLKVGLGFWLDGAPGK